MSEIDIGSRSPSLNCQRLARAFPDGILSSWSLHVVTLHDPYDLSGGEPPEGRDPSDLRHLRERAPFNAGGAEAWTRSH